MANPLVSICVPTYNRAAALRESLKAVCGQTYAPLEILISDNCSEDGTEQVGRDLMRNDPRVRYVRQSSNIGLHGNHNFCIDQSKGEFICLFHDHDERSLDIVSEYVSFMQQHPQVGVVCSDWNLIGESGEMLGVRDSDAAAVTPGLDYISRTIRSGRSSIGLSGAMVRRSALGDIRFDEQGHIGFGDFVVWFQLAETASIGHIHRRLWSWRQQRQSLSARKIVHWARDYQESLAGYCLGHLKRWPEHREMVERWGADTKRFLFWALAFELGLYFRKQAQATAKERHAQTLFEIMGYQLTTEEVLQVLEQLEKYRAGVLQGAALVTIKSLTRMKLTWPLAWVTYHVSSLRTILGLR
jgi:glycosyltransferase involved in cell wall biosynthesis